MSALSSDAAGPSAQSFDTARSAFQGASGGRDPLNRDVQDLRTDLGRLSQDLGSVQPSGPAPSASPGTGASAPALPGVSSDTQNKLVGLLQQTLTALQGPAGAGSQQSAAVQQTTPQQAAAEQSSQAAPQQAAPQQSSQAASQQAAPEQSSQAAPAANPASSGSNAAPASSTTSQLIGLLQQLLSVLQGGGQQSQAQTGKAGSQGAASASDGSSQGAGGQQKLVDLLQQTLSALQGNTPSGAAAAQSQSQPAQPQSAPAQSQQASQNTPASNEAASQASGGNGGLQSTMTELVNLLQQMLTQLQGPQTNDAAMLHTQVTGTEQA